MKSVMSRYSPSLGTADEAFRYVVTADFKLFNAVLACDSVVACESVDSAFAIFFIKDVRAVDSMLASTFFSA